MGEHTKIEWAHHTFNPWRGCTRVSPGCDHCYAEAWSKRNPKQLGTWGDDGERVIASAAYWRTPLRWDRLAREAGERRRVFCASLADVFEDRPELDLPRLRLFRLIVETPNMDWLLLTKRPGRARELLGGWRRPSGPPSFPARLARSLESEVLPWPLPNVWLGVTAEDQERADERIPILLDTPAAVRFVSYEPALGPIRFREYVHEGGCHTSDDGQSFPNICLAPSCGTALDWIIVGGESGPHARPFDIQWARDAIAQGRAAGVPVFVKQLGANPIERRLTAGKFNGTTSYPELRDRKGGDVEEWDEGLRVRQVPERVCV